MEMIEPPPILFLLGATHNTAPLALREKLSLDGPRMVDLDRILRTVDGLREFAVLNTCNRIEIYGVANGAGTVDRVQDSFCAVARVAPDVFQKVRLLLNAEPAVRHLLEVTAGVDSQMIGETEVLGQAKAAYAAAHARGTTGPVLNRIFQKSFQAAKHVRTRTGIGEGQISVASVAVDLALKIFGDLGPCRVLILGAGDVGAKTARAFRSRGAGAMTVSSRSMDHAEELANELSAQAIRFERVPETLSEFDIAVCSTAAPEPVVSRGMAATAMRHRPAQPLFFIDLAMPRNIAPAVAGLANVFLYNLDDLAKIAAENLSLREAEVQRARALLAERSPALWRRVEPRLGGRRTAP